MQETLKDLRMSAGKSIAEVASALGVKSRAVYNYEYGIRQINIAQVLVLSNLYESTAEEVIEAQLKSIRVGNAE